MYTHTQIYDTQKAQQLAHNINLDNCTGKKKVLLHCTVPNDLKNKNAKLSDLVPSEENCLILVYIPLKTAFYELMMASTERKYADFMF